MGYRVTYNISGETKIRRTSYFKRKRILAVVGIFLIITAFVFAASQNWLHALLFPGFNERSAEAASKMLNAIGDGEPVGEAVTAFCKEILADVKQK